MIPGIALRTATFGDLAFLHALSEQAFGPYGDYSGVLPDWLANPAVQTILAEEHADSRAVGFAMLGTRSPRRLSVGTGGELLAIAVALDRRRQGIGRLLVEEIERRARAAKMRELRLSTAASNLIARRLYTSLGFAVLSHYARFYPSGQSALEMAKRL
ncbi:MAG: GNAT family N-acetyltransferase [Candidatus Binatia bacterium]